MESRNGGPFLDTRLQLTVLPTILHERVDKNVSKQTGLHKKKIENNWSKQAYIQTNSGQHTWAIFIVGDLQDSLLENLRFLLYMFSTSCSENTSALLNKLTCVWAKHVLNIQRRNCKFSNNESCTSPTINVVSSRLSTICLYICLFQSVFFNMCLMEACLLQKIIVNTFM